MGSGELACSSDIGIHRAQLTDRLFVVDQVPGAPAGLQSRGTDGGTRMRAAPRAARRTTRRRKPPRVEVAITETRTAKVERTPARRRKGGAGTTEEPGERVPRHPRSMIYWGKWNC